MGYTSTLRYYSRARPIQPFQQEFLLGSLQNAAFSICPNSLIFCHIRHYQIG